MNPHAAPFHTNTHAAGFTLVEVCIALSVTLMSLLVLNTGTQTAIHTRVACECMSEQNDFANTLLERVSSLPFGSRLDSAATGRELDELLDDDDDVGTITLQRLRLASGTAGVSFQRVSHNDTSMWRLRVSRDLNGDGDETDAREGREDLMRIELFKGNARILETLRAAASLATIVDPDDYLATVPGGYDVANPRYPLIPLPDTITHQR